MQVFTVNVAFCGYYFFKKMKIFQLFITISAVISVDLKLAGLQNSKSKKCSKNSILQLLFRLPQTQCLFENILNNTLVNQLDINPDSFTGQL